MGSDAITHEMWKIAKDAFPDKLEALTTLDIPAHSGRQWWLLDEQMQALCCLGALISHDLSISLTSFQAARCMWY